MKFLTVLSACVCALAVFAAEEEPFTCCNAVYENGVYTIENTAKRKAYVKHVYEWNQTKVQPFTFGCDYCVDKAEKDPKTIRSLRVNLEFMDGTKLDWINIGFPAEGKFTTTSRVFVPKKPVRTATIIAEFDCIGKIQLKNIYAKEGGAVAAPAAKPAPAKPLPGAFGKANPQPGEQCIIVPMSLINATYNDGVYTIENTARRNARIEQTFQLDQKTPEAFTFSVEAKGDGADCKGLDCAIITSITHQDGTKITCINIGFKPSADKFTKTSRWFKPTKPVKTATFYCQYNAKGKVEFKNPSFVVGK